MAQAGEVEVFGNVQRACRADVHRTRLPDQRQHGEGQYLVGSKKDTPAYVRRISQSLRAMKVRMGQSWLVTSCNVAKLRFTRESDLPRATSDGYRFFVKACLVVSA